MYWIVKKSGNFDTTIFQCQLVAVLKSTPEWTQTKKTNKNKPWWVSGGMLDFIRLKIHTTSWPRGFKEVTMIHFTVWFSCIGGDLANASQGAHTCTNH